MEIAVTIPLFVVGIISQLEPWRLVQNRSNESKGKTSDDELGLSDEEDNIGRQVEEVANRERREWERMYGEGECSPSVGGRRSGRYGGRETRATTNGLHKPPRLRLAPKPWADCPAGSSRLGSQVEVCQAHYAEQGLGGGVTVRAVEGDGMEGDVTVVVAPAYGDISSSETSMAPETSPCLQFVPEPPIITLPIRIPTTRDGKDTNSEVIGGGYVLYSGCRARKNSGVS